MADPFRRFFQEDKDYFLYSSQAISEQNSKVLYDGCILYAFVLAFYTLFTITIDKNPFLLQLYFIFDIIHVIICASVLFLHKYNKLTSTLTKILCIIFEIALLSNFAIEGAYFEIEMPSLYIPIVIILIQILFIHRTFYTVLMITLYLTAFLIMSYNNKTTQAFTYDMYIAIASFIGSIVGYVLVSNLRHRENYATMKCTYLSKIDSLTHLYNKYTLEEKIESLLTKSNSDCSFLLIDIDNFKSLNDSLGHEIGDMILQKVASSIKKSFRSYDIKGRFGGDVFIVVIDSCNDKEALRERIGIFNYVIAKISLSNHDTRLNCSIGVTCKQKGDNFHSIYSRANMALIDAKNSKEHYSFI